VHRTAAAIPVAMLFVAVSMMLLGLGAVPAFASFRNVFWVASPLVGLVGLLLALGNLRYQRRALAAIHAQDPAGEPGDR
jgi:hypothetical protein